MTAIHLHDLSTQEYQNFTAFLTFIVKKNYARVSEGTVNYPGIPGILGPFLKYSSNQLCSKGFLSETQDANERFWELSPLAAPIAYSLAAKLGILDPATGQLIEGRIIKQPEDEVPAADRFVRIDHNSAEFLATTEALENLEMEITKSNDFRVGQEDRIAVVREIRGLADYLREPVVRLATLWSATKNNRTLQWLANETSSGAIRAMAGTVILALGGLVAKYLGVF